MLVVDTNVVASLLLNGPFTEQARALSAADKESSSVGHPLPLRHAGNAALFEFLDDAP